MPGIDWIREKYREKKDHRFMEKKPNATQLQPHCSPQAGRGIRSLLQKLSQRALAKREYKSYLQDKHTALTSFKAYCVFGKTMIPLADSQQ